MVSTTRSWSRPYCDNISDNTWDNLLVKNTECLSPQLTSMIWWVLQNANQDNQHQQTKRVALQRWKTVVSTLIGWSAPRKSSHISVMELIATQPSRTERDAKMKGTVPSSRNLLYTVELRLKASFTQRSGSLFYLVKLKIACILLRFTHLVRLRTIGLFCSLIRREEHRPSEHASVNVCLTYEPRSTWRSRLHMSGLHPQDRLLVLRSSLLSSPRNVEQRDCSQSTTWPATVQIFDENKRNCLHKKIV